jgi:glycerol-3-phosphate dehydrogenase (NAD(P)+)
MTHAFRRVSVLGDGGWGTALALLLDENGARVTLWSAFEDYAKVLKRLRRNPKFLPGVTLPKRMAITAELGEALEGADLVVSVIPTQHVRGVWARAAAHWMGAPVCSASKGLEMSTRKRPTEILRGVLGPKAPLAVLSGPSIAGEVARGLPAAVVVASTRRALADRLQRTFHSRRFRVYTVDDPVGVELGGALKNVIALAAGMCDGLRIGANAKAALLTRGVLEMSTLGIAMGAKPETFYGLSGVGDLITTSLSSEGRNRAVGEALGRGKTLARILGGTDKVTEGVWTSRAVVAFARARGVDVPISREVFRVCFEGKSPRAALAALMGRTAGNEGAVPGRT